MLVWCCKMTECALRADTILSSLTAPMCLFAGVWIIITMEKRQIVSCICDYRPLGQQWCKGTGTTVRKLWGLWLPSLTVLYGLWWPNVSLSTSADMSRPLLVQSSRNRKKKELRSRWPLSQPFQRRMQLLPSLLLQPLHACRKTWKSKFESDIVLYWPTKAPYSPPFHVVILENLKSCFKETLSIFDSNSCIF